MDKASIEQKISLAIKNLKSNNQSDYTIAIQEILQEKIGYTKVYEILAHALVSEGNPKEAINILEIIENREGLAEESLYYLAVLYLENYRYQEAINTFEKVIQKKGEFFEILFHLGMAQVNFHKYEEAFIYFSKAYKLKNNSPELLYNIAKLYEIQKDIKLAIEFYQKAIVANPNFISALLNYGVCLYEVADYYKAIECYEKIIKLNPLFIDAWTNLGNAKRQIGRNIEAIECYNKVISLVPNDPNANWNKSLSLLMEGNYLEGWDLYSYRWLLCNSQPYRHKHIPELKKLENLNQKKLLVWHEQGYGDTIQFIRFLKPLIDMGALVTAEIQESLIELMSLQLQCNCASEINGSENFDFQIPLGELPKLFKTEVKNIPYSENYIKIDSEKIEISRNKLQLSKIKLNIGLAISGNPLHENDHNRSIPLDEFLLFGDKYNFFLLQKEVRDRDQMALNKNPSIQFLGADLNNFYDTAGFVENFDMVVTVDTALAHLSASMGKKTIILIPYCPDWRWLNEGQKTPWYQSAILLRQDSSKNWRKVLRRLNNHFELHQKLKITSSGYL